MSEPFLGEIKMVGFGFAPRGYTGCDGQILPIAQNTALFSLLGTTFGGDGRTTFGLPDLRGRDAIHVGTGPGLSPIQWGQKAGAETHTLTVAQIPSHNHMPRCNNAGQNSDDPQGHVAGQGPDAYNTTANADMAVTTNTGGGQAFNIRNPYLGIWHVIALVGIFPSRN